MNKLSFEGLKVDLEIRKKLTTLIKLKDELENSEESNPLKKQQNKMALQKVNELIGIIRYNALDKLGVFNKEEEKTAVSKGMDTTGNLYGEGEQRHEQYPDLLIGRQPKIGEKQKPIEVTKAAFGPDAPKSTVDQKRKDQSYDEENIGGEHVGQVFQLSNNNSKPLVDKEEPLDLHPGASDDNQEEQELTAGEIRLLKEIDKYLMGLEED